MSYFCHWISFSLSNSLAALDRLYNQFVSLSASLSYERVKSYAGRNNQPDCCETHLICSLAVLNQRVGHTMDVHVISPFISVLCHFDWLFHGESCPTCWCHPSRPCVVFLACVHLTLFLALSLSPGNSVVSSWCDRSILVSLLRKCLTVPSLLQFCQEIHSFVFFVVHETRIMWMHVKSKNKPRWSHLNHGLNKPIQTQRSLTPSNGHRWSFL